MDKVNASFILLFNVIVMQKGDHSGLLLDKEPKMV